MSQLTWVAQAVFAILWARGRTLRLIGWLLLASALIVGAVLGTLHAYHDEIVDWALRYFLRDSWVAFVRAVVHRIMAPRMFELVANATIVLSMSLISMLLFPLRERVSTAFEEQRRLLPEAPRAPSLWVDIVDVGTQLLMIATAQMIIFALGYSPNPTRQQLARVLSYLWLFVATAIDFVPPLLARHRLRFSAALVALLRRPIAAVGFGACFSLPVIAVARFAPVELGAGKRLGLVVGASVFVIAWATVGGTQVAARMLAERPQMRRPHFFVRAVAMLTLLGLFVGYGYGYSLVAVSFQRKTQLLKCRYGVDTQSISVDLPDVFALLKKSLSTTLRMTMEVENPTEHDVEVEEGRIEVIHVGKLLATIAVPTFAVASGQKAKVPVSMPLRVDLQTAKTLALHPDRDIDATLWVKVTPTFELPIYLLSHGHLGIHR